MRRTTIVAVCLISGLVVLAIALFALARTEPRPAQSPDPETSSALREAVSPEGIMEHERRFQAIADDNSTNRAAGTPGYDASANYVAERLRKAGYRVTIQEFELPVFQETEPARLQLGGPDARDYTRGSDFAVMEYSGTGWVKAKITPVDAVGEDMGSSGCEADDFAGFAEGGVTLLRRGACTFEQKARNAEAAGASAAVIFDGRPSGTETLAATLGSPGARIPVIGTSFSVGDALLREAEDGANIHISARTISNTRTTSNVIAQMPGRLTENTVMVGAHLDSVAEGPGINDNGSGSATILEIAEEMAELDNRPRNQVRFAFWGAEELGLIGSTHYVDGLEAEELDAISAYLNFDMVGSPNHARFVYGSEEVVTVFEDYFAARNLDSAETLNLSGRSDHGPFEEEGIPTGGIFSGAGGTKSGAQAKDFGGEAGQSYDPCYHAACDDIGNVDREAVDELSDAAGHAVAVFAQRK